VKGTEIQKTQKAIYGNKVLSHKEFFAERTSEGRLRGNGADSGGDGDGMIRFKGFF